MTPAKVTTIFSNDGADATGTGVQMPPYRDSGRAIAVASIDGSGAIASSVSVQGSVDNVHWVTIGSALALSASTTDSDVLGIDYPWPFLRAVSASGSGTRTALTVTVSQ
jgi:hypothetical protein